jgi:hypothetical protein
MPTPEGRGLTQNFSPRLTNMAIGYLPNQSMFIGRRVFPGLGVGASTGEYNILPRGEWLRPQAKKLANYEAPPVGGFKFDKGLYSVDEYGISKPWTQRDLNAAAVGGIGATRFANMNTEFVTFQAHLALEIDIAAVVRTAANWTVSKTGVTTITDAAVQFLKWSDPASDPIAYIKALKMTMQLSTGFRPNKMLMSQSVLDALSEHPDLIDRVKYTGSNSSPGKVNRQSIAELFEIDEILVPEGVQNTAQEGAADNISWIWGNDVFLFYAPAAPSIELPSAGYRFNWTGAADSDGVGPAPFGGRVNSEGLYIARYNTSRPAAEWVESRWYTVPKVTAPGLGILLVGAV